MREPGLTVKKQNTVFGRGLRIMSATILLSAVTILILVATAYFKAIKTDSYLPDIRHNFDKNIKTGGNRIQLNNKWYSLVIDAGGNICVETLNGETILSNLIYYNFYSGLDEKWGLDSVSVLISDDSTICITGKGASNTDVRINLSVSGYLPKLDISSAIHYNEETQVKRESLVALFSVEPTEIYLKNSQSGNLIDDQEYWLGKQGIRFGSGPESALIYHPVCVSSLQYKTKENLLFINLEYYKDHPNIKIPYQSDGGGRWIDESEANYKPGDERENSFTVYFGAVPRITPRLMLVPDGYLAGYVFTEHADGANMKLNRAVYFGSENISSLNNATGGFAGHRIPVTKSVFYKDSNDCSVSTDSIFVDFLDQIYSTGLYDICLHTPEDGNSNRDIMKESIEFMKLRYDTRTWIDHGMYNGKINRESFVCDGLDSTSSYYAADLWRQNNTSYFWNAGPEKIREIRLKEVIKRLKIQNAFIELWRRYLLINEQRGGSNVKSLFVNPGSSVSKYELNSLEPFKGNSYPTPIYWQNLTQTGSFYSWVTDYVKDFSNLSGPDGGTELEHEKQLLDRLIKDRGVFINHGYFVRDRPGIEDGTFEELNGVTRVGRGFDKLLEYMASLRDNGDLCITTVRELLDYYLKLENISFDYRTDGTIYIYNSDSGEIKGLSMMAKAGKVRVDGAVPKFKIVGEDLVFWIDIPGHKGVVLELME